MNKDWLPYVLGVAIFTLLPIGQNQFAKELWGITSEALAPAGRQGVGPQGQYTPELLAAREQYLARKAHDEEWGMLPANQGSAAARPTTDRAQQIANAILSNPNATMADVAMASQILNGQAASGSTYGRGYVMPSYSTAPTRPRSGSSSSLVSPYNGYTTGGGSNYGPAQRSVDETSGSGSASRGFSGAQAGQSQIESTSPVILNRAGPGTYSAGNGDIYAKAGPHGVVNTRTGEFSPTN